MAILDLMVKWQILSLVLDLVDMCPVRSNSLLFWQQTADLLLFLVREEASEPLITNLLETKNQKVHKLKLLMFYCLNNMPFQDGLDTSPVDPATFYSNSD